MKLPQKQPIELMQTSWAQMIEPILSLPANNNLLLKKVSLINGTNVINHRLGRILQGWKPTRIRGPASFYDQQDSNQTPQLTLVLVSDADVVVDLEVF